MHGKQVTILNPVCSSCTLHVTGTNTRSCFRQRCSGKKLQRKLLLWITSSCSLGTMDKEESLQIYKGVAQCQTSDLWWRYWPQSLACSCVVLARRFRSVPCWRRWRWSCFGLSPSTLHWHGLTRNWCTV